MKRTSVIVAIGVLILTFQNCQKAAISASDDSLSKVEGELTPVTANDPEDAEGVVLQPEEGVQNPPAPVPEPLPVQPGNGNRPPTPAPVAGVDSGNGNVCILEGPGKSVKLGLDDSGSPRGQNKIPQVVCVSAKACLEIASQAFGVKGPEFRGYCKLPHGNPHVTHLSDAQLQAKINEYLKK